MKQKIAHFGGIVMMLESVRKIQIKRNGFCIGSIYRWRGRLQVRGNIRTKTGDIAKIYRTNGTLEIVPQNPKP